MCVQAYWIIEKAIIIKIKICEVYFLETTYTCNAICFKREWMSEKKKLNAVSLFY